MGWSTPLTAVANTVLSAGQWNASVRDNLEETTPALATSGRSIFVTDGDNKIAQRAILQDIVNTKEETASTSYTNLATFGPSVSVITGFSALVWITCLLTNSAATNSRMSYEVSGETSTAPSDTNCRESDGGSGSWSLRSTVTALESTNPGMNTFTAKYVVSGGTGQFALRRIQVMGL